MWRSMMAAMMMFAPMNPVPGEVEYEIHTGSSPICTIRAFEGGLEPGGRVLELRTYHAAPGKLDALLTRFRDHTCKLFVKHGMTNLAYFQLAEAKACGGDTLLYFLAHKDMESATKSWADFRADPDWIAAKKVSEDKAGGSLTTEGGVKSVFLKPTDFSPVK